MTNEEKALEIVNTSTLRDPVDGFGIALKMAKWKEEQLIEKAIGWIDYNNENGGCNFDEWEKDFRKAMEE